jgi:hypothetical protein
LVYDYCFGSSAVNVESVPSLPQSDLQAVENAFADALASLRSVVFATKKRNVPFFVEYIFIICCIILSDLIFCIVCRVPLAECECEVSFVDPSLRANYALFAAQTGAVTPEQSVSVTSVVSLDGPFLLVRQSENRINFTNFYLFLSLLFFANVFFVFYGPGVLG